MKTNQKLMASISMLMLVVSSFRAQESINSGGGNIQVNGSGINAYSIGQVFYSSNSDSNYNITEGVQHAYIITSLSTNEKKQKYQIQIFPNPVEIILYIKAENDKKLEFVLLDAQGKLIHMGKVTGQSTINMGGLPSAAYFVQITDEGKEIKTFKIIKK